MNLYRSLRIGRLPDESLFKILERLAVERYFLNNRKLIVTFKGFRSSRFDELICSMKNLETLISFYYYLTPDTLARVFQSCSNLIKLDTTCGRETHEIAENLKNQLIPGFQRLQYFEFKCFITNDSWPRIQKMLT